MNQYSEMMGSFIRTGNYPMEANYIFPTEAALKEFYSDPINATTIHKGLFRIVENGGDGKQALYWVVQKQTNDELEFVKLIENIDINNINEQLEDLQTRLEEEINDRKESETAIWGTDSPTQVPDDLNSLLDIAEAIISLRDELQEESERAQQEEGTIKENIQYIVGTTQEDVISYIKANLDYKSLSELSNALNKFLNSTDNSNNIINTLPELQSFLSGFKDNEVLKNVLQKIVDDIMGDPIPSQEFRTFRSIEDFIRTLQANLLNITANIQSEVDQTQIGVGLSGDGSFNADQETYYLKQATSVMNALKILDSLINEAINNCNIQSEDTNTVSVDINKQVQSTTIKANVLLSTESGNSIIAKTDGLYHSVRSTYANGVLTLYVNDTIISQHVLGLAYVGIQKAYYDTTSESLVFVFTKEDGTLDELRVPVTSLIREWVTDNSGVSDVVVLTRIEDYTGNPDKLSADVRLFQDKYNILKKEGNTLYVKGTADNIVWKDVQVGVLLDTLSGDIQGLKDKDVEIVTITDNIKQEISDEVTRAKQAEYKLQTFIENVQSTTSDRLDLVENKSNQNASGIITLSNKIDNEITRATQAETILKGEIVNEQQRAQAAETTLTTITTKQTTDISNLNTNLQSEIERAKLEETNLNKAILEETSRASIKENELESKIALEEERAKGAENVLEQKVFVASNDAVKAVQTAETANERSIAVETKIDTEITRATTQEQVLTHKIEDEVSRATREEQLLQSAVNSKISEIGVLRVSDLEYNITADGVAVGTISIPKDEHLIDVSYDPLLKILTFKVITKDGEKTIQINISDLVDTYTSGDGLSLSNNQFSVQIDPNSERYITVSSQGIKFIGLDEIVTLTNKINTNLEVEIARAKAAEAALEEKYNTFQETYQEALDKKADITMFDWNEE